MSNPVGRPTIYTPELGQYICERHADGESITAICKDDMMPHRSTIYEWRDVHPDFSDRLSRAQKKFAECLLDETLEIADDPRHDWQLRETKSGEQFWGPDHEHIRRSEIRIKARENIAARVLKISLQEKRELLQLKYELENRNAEEEAKRPSKPVVFVTPDAGTKSRLRDLANADPDEAE